MGGWQEMCIRYALNEPNAEGIRTISRAKGGDCLFQVSVDFEKYAEPHQFQGVPHFFSGIAQFDVLLLPAVAADGVVRCPAFICFRQFFTTKEQSHPVYG